jgi:hypothetical protein
MKIDEAEILLRSARKEIRTAPDLALVSRMEFKPLRPPLRRPGLPKVRPGSKAELLNMNYRNAWFAERPAVDVTDLLDWLDRRQPKKSPTKSGLKRAPRSAVENEIAAVYEEAAKRNSKPPNINELPYVVLPRLKSLGYETSGKQIKEIGRANEFAKHRGPVGKRRT